MRLERGDCAAVTLRVGRAQKTRRQASPGFTCRWPPLNWSERPKASSSQLPQMGRDLLSVGINGRWNQWASGYSPIRSKKLLTPSSQELECGL